MMRAPSGTDPASVFLQKALLAVSEAVEHDGLEDALEQRLEELRDEFLETTVPALAEPVLKVLSDDERLVSGWASVVTERGVDVVDRQGDIFPIDELRKSVHEFIEKSRRAGEMHVRLHGIGTLVDSVVLGKREQDALGVDLGREGWWVTVRVDDDRTWAKVKSGELRAFSFGGSGERVPVSKAQARQPAGAPGGIGGEFSPGGGGTVTAGALRALGIRPTDLKDITRRAKRSTKGELAPMLEQWKSMRNWSDAQRDAVSQYAMSLAKRDDFRHALLVELAKRRGTAL